MASSTSGSSGITGVSCYPPYGPYFFPPPAYYRCANSRGAPYSAESGQWPRLFPVPATGTRAAIYGALCPGAMPGPICSPGGPDWRRGRCAGDCPGWLLYAPTEFFTIPIQNVEPVDSSLNRGKRRPLSRVFCAHGHARNTETWRSI